MAENYVKIVQCDSRGQIVIPKGIRKELKLKKGSAFWIYMAEEGIFLKKIDEAPSITDIKKSAKKKNETE